MKMNIIRTLGYSAAAASLLLPAFTFASTDLGVNVDANVGAKMQVQTQSNSHMENENGSMMDVEASGSASTSEGMHSEGNATSSEKSHFGGPATGAINAVVNISRNDQGKVTDVTVTTPASVRTDTDVESYAHSVINKDENVTNVTIGSTTVAVSYKVPAKFLGFIPASITINAESDESGNVNISYPWYSFLMKAGSSATLKASAEAKAHAAVQSAVMVQNASTTSSTTMMMNESFGAHIKALILNALHTALEADTNGSASTSAQ